MAKKNGKPTRVATQLTWAQNDALDRYVSKSTLNKSAVIRIAVAKFLEGQK